MITTLAQHPLRELADATLAVDRLNRHARIPSAWSIKTHIYALKGAAIDRLDQLGVTQSRVISVRATCKTCRGTGIFNERHMTPCNRCENASGTAVLHFRETTIHPTFACMDWPLDTIRWHIPIHWTTANEHAVEPVTDWKPNQPGIALDPEELAEALNLAEPAFITGKMYHAQQFLNFYLGTANEQCVFCNSTHDLERHNFDRGCLRWSASVCKPCIKHSVLLVKRYGRSLRDRIAAPPPELLTPSIATWIERHGGLKLLMAQYPLMEDAA